MEPATKLVILWPTEGRQRVDRSFRSTARTRAAIATASYPRLRWILALLTTATFLFITACAALRDDGVNAKQPDVVSSPPRPSSIPVIERTTPHSASTSTRTNRLVSLEEGVRERIAARLGVPTGRLLVEFETPAAARLVLGRSATYRIEPTQTSDGWLVVFDSIPGARPELRLPLRAVLQPGTRPMQQERGR